MFPRLRGAWRPSRRVALAVVPAAFGALLFLAGDRPPAATSRLEATQGVAPVPLSGDRAPATTAAVPPATPGPETPPPTPGILGEALAAALASDPEGDPAAATGPATEGSQPAPADGAPVSAAPAASGTDAFTAPATAESSAAPRATSGETSSPATPSSTATTATTAATTTTTTTAPPPAGPEREPGVEAEVVPLTNADRTANGLVALSRNGCLDTIASRYAKDLAVSGVLAHNPGAGAAVRECRPNSAWGDNVGTASPCSAAVLEERWMASPSHRRNILTGEFRYIGVGAWTDADGACWVQVLFSS